MFFSLEVVQHTMCTCRGSQVTKGGLGVGGDI